MQLTATTKSHRNTPVCDGYARRLLCHRPAGSVSSTYAVADITVTASRFGKNLSTRMWSSSKEPRASPDGASGESCLRSGQLLATRLTPPVAAAANEPGVPAAAALPDRTTTPSWLTSHAELRNIDKRRARIHCAGVVPHNLPPHTKIVRVQMNTQCSHRGRQKGNQKGVRRCNKMHIRKYTNGRTQASESTGRLDWPD